MAIYATESEIKAILGEGVVLKLGVNVDHVATLRQARGTRYPDVVEAALLCERAGAKGITVHLREDRRHIQDADVRALRSVLSVPLNLEMANAPEIVASAVDVKPDEVCMVPEKREELTTEGGLDVVGHAAELEASVAVLTRAGCVVSLFIDPDPEQIRMSSVIGAPCIELHTGTFCDASEACDRDVASAELARLVDGARCAHDHGLQVNAGHGINVANLADILRIPFLDTLNIGHSIVARAVFLGLDGAVREMLEGMTCYAGGDV